MEELDAKDQLTEHDGPTEALSRWLDLNNVEPWQKARLMELAAPIIAKADHGMDDGHSTGAFLPISIEVKNYRSYTDAAFSFEPVHMAMVNGANGVGKSSLFMDAIADCLYEQTRKEDIGGWVREGTKSGSIIFTFAMGEKKYRVVRTRTASGRGTLALQCFDAENQEWADGSDTTMRLTQAKIERLLGMDCNTFCSIALIRQDAYGLFLDADSDRRMEVLSALLGLDLYNRMAEITAAESKEQRRTIASAKDMSAKNLDNHNRWRSKTIAFRVSPEENEQIEIAVRLSGLTKQDYITRRLLNRDIVVQGNPRVYKALRDQLAAVLGELRRMEAGGGVDDELLATIRLITVTLGGMKED